MIKKNTKQNTFDIISLSGFIGSGKSTLARILVSDYGYTELAFGTRLKDVVSVAFEYPRHLMEGDTPESRKFRDTVDEYWTDVLGFEFTPRKAMQIVGTQVFRDHFNSDFWVHAVMKQIEPSKKYVISDTRFVNEMEMCVKRKAATLRVKRGPEPEWFDIARDAQYLNNSYQKMIELEVPMSEWEWVSHNFDYTVVNDGNVKELRDTVEKLLQN